MNSSFPFTRALLITLLGGVSLFMAWINGLGYVWSGAWSRSTFVSAAAAYLPLYFALGWLLIPATRRWAICGLWASAVVALSICVGATLDPDWYPLKITPVDFVVGLALPMGAAVYRRIL